MAAPLERLQGFEAELEAGMLAAQISAAWTEPQSAQAGKFSERSEVLARVGSSSRSGGGPVVGRSRAEIEAGLELEAQLFAAGPDSQSAL